MLLHATPEPLFVLADGASVRFGQDDPRVSTRTLAPSALVNGSGPRQEVSESLPLSGFQNNMGESMQLRLFCGDPPRVRMLFHATPEPLFVLDYRLPYALSKDDPRVTVPYGSL